MSNITKAIAALGVVASLGVTALPLSTYADTDEGKSAQSSAIPVTAEVNTTIAVSTDKNAINLGSVVLGGPVATDTIDVTVTTVAAKDYNLYVMDSDDKTGLYTTKADGTLETTNQKYIPAGVAAKGTTAWGYRVANSGEAFRGVNEYGITDLDDDNALVSSTTAGTATPYDGTTTVEFGASIASSTFTGSDGTYTGGVVFVATAQN